MSLLPLLASMQKLLTSYVPRKDAAATSQTASQASTPTDTAIVPSQADSVTISPEAKEKLNQADPTTISKKAKAELQQLENDLRKEKILEQEERLKMLIAQVLSQNPRSPLTTDEIYGIWEKYKNAEETIDQASEEIIEDLEKILQDNASVEEVTDETPTEI